MKSLILFFLVFISFSHSAFSQDDVFNEQLQKAEKAVEDKDLSKAKNILATSEALKSKKNNKKIKDLNIKVLVLECILNGNSNISTSNWNDAIIESDKGIALINANPKIFTGTEKSELENIKLDAENGKKGIKPSSSTISANAIKLDDLGDPVDYRTGKSQMLKTYQDEKNAPFIEFEKYKDTIMMENNRREDLLYRELTDNMKNIDSAKVKMEIEQVKIKMDRDSNYVKDELERSKVKLSNQEQYEKVKENVKVSNKETEKNVSLISEANYVRIKELNQTLDSNNRENSVAKNKIQSENEKRFESISKNQKLTDSLSYLVNSSLQVQSKNIANSVAENAKQMEEYVQSEKPKTIGSGMVNSKGVPYQKGVTQGVFSKGDKGKTQVLITRRVKIDVNNNADVYLRYECPNTVTTYTKNGESITQYIWDVESGNVTYFE
jgi:hypothetical protein